MCDCYIEHCIICGRPIPFHLGDFDTERDEIAVICGDHWGIAWHLEEERIPYYEVTFEGKFDLERVLTWLKEIINEKDPEWHKDRREFIKEKVRELAEWGGKTIYIIPLTENAVKNAYKNYPNVFLNFEFNMKPLRKVEYLKYLDTWLYLSEEYYATGWWGE